jgi:hypothetical protein
VGCPRACIKAVLVCCALVARAIGSTAHNFWISMSCFASEVVVWHLRLWLCAVMYCTVGPSLPLFAGYA